LGVVGNIVHALADYDASAWTEDKGSSGTSSASNAVSCAEGFQPMSCSDAIFSSSEKLSEKCIRRLAAVWPLGAGA